MHSISFIKDITIVFMALIVINPKKTENKQIVCDVVPSQQNVNKQ